MSAALCDASIEILRATRDGNELAPEHLALVQQAINDHLSVKGVAAFADLLAQVRAGYVKPWLHDVEHLTIDTQGYVFWKGIQVEHWSGDLSWSAHGKEAAHELARRCLILEGRGTPVTCSAVVWQWKE